MANRNVCFPDFSKQKTAKERWHFLVARRSDREEYLETPLSPPPESVRTFARSLARSVVRWLHHQIFWAWRATIFSYPSCFAGALRALKLHYDVVMVKDENVHRNAWTLGRVEEVFPSHNRLVKKVKLWQLNYGNSYSWQASPVPGSTYPQTSFRLGSRPGIPRRGAKLSRRALIEGAVLPEGTPLTEAARLFTADIYVSLRNSEPSNLCCCCRFYVRDILLLFFESCQGIYKNSGFLLWGAMWL